MASNRMSAVLLVFMTRNFSKMFLSVRRALEFSHSLGPTPDLSSRSKFLEAGASWADGG
jgi:hypothetical protein